MMPDFYCQLTLCMIAEIKSVPIALVVVRKHLKLFVIPLDPHVEDSLYIELALRYSRRKSRKAAKPPALKR